MLAFLQASNNPAKRKRYETAALQAATVSTPTAGALSYNQTCVACHGADGKGVLPGVPDFTRKAGPLAKTDDLLLKHIIAGFQSPGSPMAMPPKGGNLSLTKQDIQTVLQYIRKRFGS